MADSGDGFRRIKFAISPPTPLTNPSPAHPTRLPLCTLNTAPDDTTSAEAVDAAPAGLASLISGTSSWGSLGVRKKMKASRRRGGGARIARSSSESSPDPERRPPKARSPVGAAATQGSVRRLPDSILLPPGDSGFPILRSDAPPSSSTAGEGNQTPMSDAVPRSSPKARMANYQVPAGLVFPSLGSKMTAEELVDAVVNAGPGEEEVGNMNILDLAKQMGIIFPTPSWWPPGGYSDDF